jgi:hypothetical protein
MLYVCNGMICSTIKEGILSHVIIWMTLMLKDIMLNKVSQSQKDKYYIIPLKWMLWFEHIPQSSCVSNFIPNVTVLISGTYKRWLGHGHSILVNELMSPRQEWVPYKRTNSDPFFSPSCPLLSSHLPPWDDTAMIPLPNTGPSMLDFSTSRTEKNKFLFFINYLLSGILS